MPKTPELRYYLLDLEQITCPIAGDQFDPDVVEALTDNLLACGGTVHPLVVKMVSLDKYQVIVGALEYHAALRAQQKDPSFEKIGGYIVDSKNEDLVRSQLAILPSALQPSDRQPPVPVHEPTHSPEDRWHGTLDRFEQTCAALNRTLDRQSQSFVALQDAVLHSAIAQSVTGEYIMGLIENQVRTLIMQELEKKPAVAPQEIKVPASRYTIVELEKMSVSALKEIAKVLGISGCSKLKKDEIIGKIMAIQDGANSTF
jgi:hypothetical protein